MLGNDEFRLPGIGHLFILEKLLEKHQAIAFNKLASAHNVSLVQYLVTNNILSAAQIVLTASRNFGVPMLDLDCIDIQTLPIHLVNAQLIRRHTVVPLFCRGNQVYLAMDDPSKQAALKEIQFHTGFTPHVLVVEADKLAHLIDYLLRVKEHQGLVDSLGEAHDFNELNLSEELSEKDDAPIVTFVNKILLDAINQGTSDIHFEPYEKEYRIRYRQDGLLTEVTTPPLRLSARISARIKIMSNLDSSERRIPQDGGFKLKISKNRSIDCRVSTCPTTAGEKVVIRILDSPAEKLLIDALGLNKQQKKDFLHAIERPQGMILVTGPTGSGKTVTLYTALNWINTKEVNISTAEDPVEIKVSGINQVQINPKAGLTFARVLRSLLRQDPDIIMVGEVRDLETAEIAVKAAQTGHLVLSTLHTNSAAETLNRLVTMGIVPFHLASSVSLIIAQRLARKLCTQCKVLRNDLSQEELLVLGFNADDLVGIKVYQAVGCTHCTKGYCGRIGLFEVMQMTKTMGQLIMSGGNSYDILKCAQAEGMITVYQSGLEKVKQGITSIEEINRVTID